MNTFVNRMTIDRWNGTFCTEDEIRAPSITDIDQIIDKLDAKSRTLACLYGQDGSCLCIGGGAGRYVVYASNKSEFWNLLVNGPEEKGVIMVNAGGQEGDFPARQVIRNKR